MSFFPAPSFTEQTLDFHLIRRNYATVLSRAAQLADADFRRSMPSALCLDGTFHQRLQLVEDALSNGSLDRARAIVRASRNHAPLFGHDIVRQTDMLCVLQLLQKQQQAHAFVHLPTSDNVHRLLVQRDDRGLRDLLDCGAPMLTLTQLVDLFGADMPHTINYLLDNCLIPYALMRAAHFEACINTPNVRLVHNLVSYAPAVIAYIGAQSEAQRLRYQAAFFYWNVRSRVGHYNDAESLRSLKACIDLELLSAIDVVRLLRSRDYDCFAELSDSALLRVWAAVTVDSNPFQLWSAFVQLYDRFVAPKINYTEFFMQAIQTFSMLDVSPEEKSQMIASVLLDQTLHVTLQTDSRSFSLVLPHACHAAA
jgi:hypothetical protein